MREIIYPTITTYEEFCRMVHYKSATVVRADFATRSIWVIEE